MPVASMTSAEAGALRFRPTSTMCLPWMCTSPRAKSPRAGSIVMTVPPRNTRWRAGLTGARDAGSSVPPSCLVVERCAALAIRAAAGAAASAAPIFKSPTTGHRFHAVLLRWSRTSRDRRILRGSVAIDGHAKEAKESVMTNF